MNYTWYFHRNKTQVATKISFYFRENRVFFLSFCPCFRLERPCLLYFYYDIMLHHKTVICCFLTKQMTDRLFFCNFITLNYSYIRHMYYVFSDITAATRPQLMSTRTYFICRYMWLSPSKPKWKRKYVPFGWWNWTKRDVSYENIIKTTTIKFQIQEFIIPLMVSSCRKQMMKKIKLIKFTQ